MVKVDPKIKKSWENFLDPEILRSNLIIGSIYITAFEILKSCIIERVKAFFTDGFNQDGPIINSKYKSQVLLKNDKPLYPSLDWLIKMKIIDESDLAMFGIIKERRNQLAHEMLDLLKTNFAFNVENDFNNLINLLHKIEVWWLKEVEIATDPEFNDKDINYDKVIPGSIITLRLMMDIAMGSKEESEFYFKECFKENGNG